MPYIEPNSVVQVFKGINLDNRYMHTIYFASESAQNTWFTGKVFKSYEKMSYLRYGRNQIKVKDDATTLLGCTYLRFRNTRTDSKWFYAFVNGIEYLNENTVLLTYEIDVMQTWFIQNGSVLPCLVKREHVNDDTWASNLEAEPFGSDIYDRILITDANSNDEGDSGLFGDPMLSYDVVINTSADPAAGSGYSHVGGIYNGTAYNFISNASPQAIDGFLLSTLGSWDKEQQSADVLDMFTFPAGFCHTDIESHKYHVTVPRQTNFGLYSPKNQKMNTYPYSFLNVTTKNGASAQFKWEFFADDDLHSPHFIIAGTPIGGGSIACYPRMYNHINDDFDDKLVMEEFPKNAYQFDAYQAWIANGGKTRLENAEDIQTWREISASAKLAFQSTKTITQDASGVASNVVNIGTTKSPNTILNNAIGGVQGTINTGMDLGIAMANAIELGTEFKEARNKLSYQWKDAAYAPNIAQGSAAPCLSVSLSILNFYFYHVALRETEAKHIDEQFTMYGYAVNKVKAPNLTGRRYWNFVQTDGCVIAGDMPASSKEAIARIFDGGITFWHNGNQVGNYRQSVTQDTIDNPII